MLIKGILTLGILIVIGGLGIPYFGSGFLGIQDEGRAAKIVEFTRNLTDVMLTVQITDPSGESTSAQIIADNGGATSLTTANLALEMGNLFSKEIQVDQGIVVPAVVTLEDGAGSPGTTQMEVLVVSSDELSDAICEDINKTLDLPATTTVDGEDSFVYAADGVLSAMGTNLDGTHLDTQQTGASAQLATALATVNVADGSPTAVEGACFQDETTGINAYVHIVGEL